MTVPDSAAIGDGVFDATLRLRIQRARDRAVVALRRQRSPAGGWLGELSSSALSTATAVTALTLVSRHDSAAEERLREAAKLGDVRTGMSLYFGADTGFGPLYLALTHAPRGSSGVMLFLGRP